MGAPGARGRHAGGAPAARGAEVKAVPLATKTTNGNPKRKASGKRWATQKPGTKINLRDSKQMIGSNKTEDKLGYPKTWR